MNINQDAYVEFFLSDSHWHPYKPSIEIDVLSSLDGEIYCSHNHELEKETISCGYIHKMKSTELEGIKTGSYSHPNNQKKMPKSEAKIRNFSFKIIYMNIVIYKSIVEMVLVR